MENNYIINGNSSIPSAPPSYNYSRNEHYINKSDQLEQFCQEYEISQKYIEKIAIIEDFKIILLLDDSGSMNTPLYDNSHYGTRWNKLKYITETCIKLSSIYKENGITIEFLNRNGQSNIMNFNQILPFFNEPPFGRTPLNKKVKSILSRYATCRKKVLIIIPTDGEPTDDYGFENIKEFTDTLMNKNHSKFHISFLACSDQKNEIGYLDKLKKIPNVNIMHNYIDEVKKIKKKEGKNYSYTFGEHIIKFLLGPIIEFNESRRASIIECNIL